MNEIIPWIERQWMDWARHRGHSARLVYVEENSLQENVSAYMAADLVIVTCFTTSIARLVWIARKKLSISTKLLIYLHNQATIACWPFFKWKMGEVLTDQDVFIGSCSRDEASMNISFRNSQVKIHPFSLEGYELSIPPLAEAPKPHFVFIGRISPQKNLHTFFWALALLKEEHPELDWTCELFGQEDHLGTPLMGISNDNYLSFLEALLVKLNLKESVFFRGFCDRKEIQKEMDAYQHVFFAPSLHSDENFGIAAFRCLSTGHQALLSDWGGHADYQPYFPETLSLVTVHEGPFGPFIDVHELKDSLYQAATKGPVHTQNSRYYTQENLFSVFDDLVNKDQSLSHPLIRTELGARIESKREIFQHEKGCQIFQDFSDEDSFQFFRTYGMRASSREKSSTLQLAPWVRRQSDGLIQIDDPQKGSLSMQVTNDWLWRCGYLS